jgi:mRNA interferase MazF
VGAGAVTHLVRGRIYRAKPLGFAEDKYFVVVSNNSRNRHLDSALVVRFTTSSKPALPSIVEIPDDEVLPGGRVVCDDIYELFDDEVKADMGALSPASMHAIGDGLRAALGLR